MLTIQDINSQINHEPRVLDTKIAKALGFERPVNIRRLIKRNAKTLARFGTLSTVERVIRGGKALEYYLTEKQALYLCTKSEAEKAIDVTIQMVELFYQFRHGQVKSTGPTVEQIRTGYRIAHSDMQSMLEMAYTRLEAIKLIHKRIPSYSVYWQEVLEENATGLEKAFSGIGRLLVTRQ